MLDLAIVIVNYNTREFLRECLASIYESRGDFSYEVWVVDNASSDGSVEMVRKRFPEVKLIANEENLGFAPANNQALRALGFASRYILLLNPDTLLPPFALRDMLEFLDSHPEAGVAGPRLVREDGSLDLACRRSFPTPLSALYRLTGLSKLFPKSKRFGSYNLTYLDPNEVTEVDSVVGAFMMIRGEALKQIGLLDERFFAYGEDLDFCYRAKVEKGWKVLYNPDVTVLHYKGKSSRQRSNAMILEFYKAMRLFHNKHYRKRTLFFVNWMIDIGIFAFCCLELFRNFLRPRGRKGVASAVSFLNQNYVS
jgi:hypothetical protein